MDLAILVGAIVLAIVFVASLIKTGRTRSALRYVGIIIAAAIVVLAVSNFV